MEGNFNYMNKWIFGHEAINKLYALGYVLGVQYSQKESTAEDARMDNRLTMDISRLLWHPLATMTAQMLTSATTAPTTSSFHSSFLQMLAASGKLLPCLI
jgi:hypothetical protein